MIEFMTSIPIIKTKMINSLKINNLGFIVILHLFSSNFNKVIFV
jgi:hypothetical protein